jgi:hypothetical protein
MGRGLDLIIGRRGDSLTGRVLDDSFDIQTDLGKLTIVTDRMRRIHFRNPPQTPADEIWLANGDRLSGAIQRDAVAFQPEGGPKLHIPREQIHTVMVGGGIDLKARPLV